MKRALGLKRRSEGVDVESATMLELASKCWFLQGVSDTNFTPALVAAPEHSGMRQMGNVSPLCPMCPRLQTSTVHQRASNPGCRKAAACRAKLLGEQIPEQAHSVSLLFPGQALYRQRVCP